MDRYQFVAFQPLMQFLSLASTFLAAGFALVTISLDMEPKDLNALLPILEARSTLPGMRPKMPMKHPCLKTSDQLVKEIKEAKKKYKEAVAKEAEIEQKRIEIEQNAKDLMEKWLALKKKDSKALSEDGSKALQKEDSKIFYDLLEQIGILSLNLGEKRNEVEHLDTGKLKADLDKLMSDLESKKAADYKQKRQEELMKKLIEAIQKALSVQ